MSDAEARGNPTNQPPLSEETIRETLGMRLIVEFPRFQTDPATVISYHDELQRLGGEYGWEHVIGSFYSNPDAAGGDGISLGIFMHQTVIPEQVDQQG